MTSTEAVVRPGHRRVLVDLIPRTWWISTALILGTVALISLAAQLALPIPGSPVPVTGQTLVVLVAAAALGPARAIVSMLVYIAVGVAGLPVFTGQAHGISQLIGATGGYLLGFVAAAAFIGACSRRGTDRSVIRELVVMIVGSAIVYVFGVSILMANLHLGLPAALTAGVVPFLVGDAIKIAVAAGVLPAAWRLVGRAGR